MMNIQKLISAMTMLAAASLVYAEAAPQAEAKSTDIVVYIQPQEYNNSIKLWQYYRDYWFMQGPLVEAEARKTLGAEFGEIGMCDENQTAGKVLVWLRPRMFYNPQVQTYYGTITAVAYNAHGKPIATYSAETQKRGYLDVYPEQQIKTVYKQAMQVVVDKMKADPNLQAALKSSSSNEAKTPCSMVTLLPAPKIQFMSF